MDRKDKVGEDGRPVDKSYQSFKMFQNGYETRMGRGQMMTDRQEIFVAEYIKTEKGI